MFCLLLEKLSGYVDLCLFIYLYKLLDFLVVTNA